MRLVVLLSFVFCSAAPAQEIVTVTNAASPDAVPAAAFAPGSIIRVAGTRGASLPRDSKLEVLSGGSTASQEVPVLAAPGEWFIGPVLALLPAGLPPGPAELRVISAGRTTGSAQINIVRNAVALFTRSGDGTGPAVSQNVTWYQPPVLNTLMDPVLPGEYLTLWATGLGSPLPHEVSVEVGGKPVSPSYAGPAPGFPGLDQINLPLPAGAPEGCYVSVRIRAGESVSNTGTVAVARLPGPCDHPLGLGESEMRALDSGQVIPFALFTIRSDIDRPFGAALTDTKVTRTEDAAARFEPRDAASIARLAQARMADEQYFTCELVNPSVSAIFGRAEEVDAGDKLTVTGPNRVLDLPKAAIPNLYTGLMPLPDPVASSKDLPEPFFAAGLWQWNAPGGKTLGPFLQNTTLSPPLRWTNRDAVAAIDRAAGQTVTWAADGYTDEVVTATLSSGYFAQALPSTARASGLFCRGPASAGRLTLPAALVAQIPDQRMPPGGTLQLRLAPRPWSRQRFSLPLVDGGKMPGAFDPYWADTLRVTIR